MSDPLTCRSWAKGELMKKEGGKEAGNESVIFKADQTVVNCLFPEPLAASS